MDLSIVNVPALVGPIVGGVAVLGLFGHRREMEMRQKRADELARAERIKHARLPEGAAYIATTDVPRGIRDQVVGYFMVVGIGTFGLNQLRRLLILIWQCGLEKLVGSILAVESDAQMRDQFYKGLPACYRDRVVFGYSDVYGGGKANQSIRRSLDHIDLWGVGPQKAGAEVIDLQLRRNVNRAPGNAFVFLGMGGSSVDGLPVIEEIHQHFQETQIVGFVTLPKHKRLRKRFAWLKSKYEKRGVVGWLAEDNLNPDPVSTDYGMVASVVALADAALYADHPIQPNNALSLALTEAPGAILLYQVVATSVVGFPFTPDPTIPLRHYVFKQPVVEQVLKALRRVEENEGVWSMDLPVGEEGTAVFDIVMLGLYHDTLKEVEDDVRAGRRLRARFAGQISNDRGSRNGAFPVNLFGQADYETPFASITTVVDPKRPVCPVVVVRLAAARHAGNLVRQMVRVPDQRSSPGMGNGRVNGSHDKAVGHGSSLKPTTGQKKE